MTAATRRATLTPNLAGLDLTVVSGDPDAPSQLDAWVQGHDLVVDAAAPYPVWLFRPKEPAELDPQGYAEARTRRLIDAVLRHRARLALVGSFTTLPHPGAERGELEPRILYRSHPYFAVKETIEAMVLEACRRGLEAVVVNPTAFLGPWDLKAPSMSFLPSVLTGRVPATTGRVVNFIDVRDVAAALLEAFQARRFGEKIPLSGHDVKISDLVRQACEIHEIRPPRLHGSSWLGAGLAYWAEAALGVLGERSPMPALPLLLVRYSYPMEAARSHAAQRELCPATRPLSSTLRDAIDWYGSIGYLGAR